MQYLRQRLYLHKHPSSGIYGTGNFEDKACETAGIDSLIVLNTLNAARLQEMADEHCVHHNHTNLPICKTIVVLCCFPFTIMLCKNVVSLPIL